MNQTSGDSEAYIVCMSTKKENKRGLDVIANGAKGADFLALEIPLEDGTMKANDTLETKKGIIKFPPKTFNAVASNRDDRRTIRAIKRSKNNGFEK